MKAKLKPELDLETVQESLRSIHARGVREGPGKVFGAVSNEGEEDSHYWRLLFDGSE